MQKVLLGCLIVVVVLVGAGGTAGYFLLVKPAWEFVGGIQEFSQEYARLNDQVEHQQEGDAADGRGHDEHRVLDVHAYQPPTDGGLDSDQFQRFLVAQRDMRQTMEGEFDTLKARFEAMNADIQAEERDMNFSELFGAYQGLGELLLKAKGAQVEALNRYNFSLQEYLYVRNQSFRALGEEVSVASFGDQAQFSEGRLPEDVIEMVAPHRQELMEGYALAWFGI